MWGETLDWSICLSSFKNWRLTKDAEQNIIHNPLFAINSIDILSAL